MQIARAQLFKLVENLPENVDLEEVLYRLTLRQKLDAAEEDIRAGRLLSEDEVDAEIARWFDGG
jgi:predicted transcriptional regulator